MGIKTRNMDDADFYQLCPQSSKAKIIPLSDG